MIVNLKWGDDEEGGAGEGGVGGQRSIRLSDSVRSQEIPQRLSFSTCVVEREAPIAFLNGSVLEAIHIINLCL